MTEEDLQKIEILLEKKFGTYLQHLTYIYNILNDIKNRVSNLEFDLKPIDTKILGETMDQFDLSIRTMNVLNSLNIRTLQDLCCMKKSELLKVRGCGNHVLRELEAFLESHYLRFGMGPSK